MSGRRIKFLRDFDYHPAPSITIAYKAGMVQFVRLECAQQAVSGGYAEHVPAPEIPSGLGRLLKRATNERPG